MNKTLRTSALAACAAILALAGILPASAETITVPNVDAGAPNTNYCTDADYDSGFGGQHVECEWTCKGPATIQVESHANDDSGNFPATVQADGTCEENVHCEGRGGCTSEPATITAGGAGTCTADSDEFWDSGLWVRCSAEAQQVDPPGPKQYCPVEVPPLFKVCINRPAPNCQIVESAIVTVNDRCEATVQPPNGVPPVGDLLPPLQPPNGLPPISDLLPPLDNLRPLLDDLLPPVNVQPPTCSSFSLQGLVLGQGAPVPIQVHADSSVCEILQEITSSQSATSSSASIIGDHGTVYGLVCNGLKCVSVVPSCTLDGLGKPSCSIA